MANRPISNELREAFDVAILLLNDLEKGGEEDRVSYEGWDRSICDICTLVKPYNDRMPDETYKRLEEVASNILGELWNFLSNEKGPERPKVPERPKDHSYRSGAEHLEALYEARKRLNEVKQQNRAK
ncbi:MAG: hypothetical protein ACLQME_20355 [Alphaproteobacteria bacterium]